MAFFGNTHLYTRRSHQKAKGKLIPTFLSSYYAFWFTQKWRQIAIFTLLGSLSSYILPLFLFAIASILYTLYACIIFLCFALASVFFALVLCLLVFVFVICFVFVFCTYRWFVCVTIVLFVLLGLHWVYATSFCIHFIHCFKYIVTKKEVANETSNSE